MKKLWILLVALAMLGAAPLFASDVTLSGEFMGYSYYDFSAKEGGAGFPKVELNLAAAVDDFNTLKLEMDSEGDDFTNANVGLDDIRLITDWGAALGLPVGIKTTIGYFDTYFTGWYYWDQSGWTWYYDWPNGMPTQGPDQNGAVQLDVAAGPVNIHWYNDGGGQDFMAGVDGGFAGLSFWLAYGATFQAFGDGMLSVEASYAIMDMANASAFFRYDLGATAFTYGLNLGATFGMFSAAAGLEGDNTDALDNIVVEASVAPIEAAKVVVDAYMDLGGANAFAGLDVSGRYKVGAAEFIVGYAYAPEGTTITVYGDNYAVNGLYAGFYIPY